MLKGEGYLCNKDNQFSFKHRIVTTAHHDGLGYHGGSGRFRKTHFTLPDIGGGGVDFFIDFLFTSQMKCFSPYDRLGYINKAEKARKCGTCRMGIFRPLDQTILKRYRPITLNQLLG